MLSTVLPIYLMEYATAYWHFLAIGLFVGLAGGSFSVGTPYGALVFPRQARPGHGRVWRWQLGRGGKQIRRPGADCRWRLDAGAQGVRRGDAGDGDFVLAVQRA